MMKKIVKANSLEETKKLATNLAKQLKGGEIICLIGDLGVGKTYFTKFLAEALGIKQDDVVSPTFVYWRQHKGRNLNIHHFDFYRFDISTDPAQIAQELGDIGIEEAFGDESAVTIIEWADRIQGFLPEERLEIHIENEGDFEREFTFKMLGAKYKKLVISDQPACAGR